MSKIKLGVWGDAVTPTGFSRVLHSIIKGLSPEEYDIFWLGVNYYGDPHSYKDLRIYPAGLGTFNDPYGFSRAKSIFELEKPDIIFLLNDAWILDTCLNIIKETYGANKRPKLVTYVPVDAGDHNPDWYKNFDIVDKVVAYTEFGKAMINMAAPDLKVSILPHGVDSSTFYKIDAPKLEIKKQLYPNTADYLEDSFIVLNANRNQPRKRLDLTMQGFAMFAENKPENVKLYMHTGIQDQHINIITLALRYGIDKRLIITNHKTGVQTVPDTALNLIYNGTDAGLNTSIGEGWSLIQSESAITGAPQVVAGHSALKELYQDCGVLIPVSQAHVIDKIMTTGYIVNPVDVAEKLEYLYSNKEVYDTLSKKSIEKFTSPIYQWSNISKQWSEIFKDLVA